MSKRLWHLEHKDGSKYTNDELERALPYPLAVPLVDMTGKLFFAQRYEIEESEGFDLVVVFDE